VQVSQPTPERLAALASIEGVGVVNLEGPIGAPLRAISASHLVNDARVPTLLRAAGVGVIGLANNHRADLGAGGVRASVEGIESAGLRAADRGRPAHWQTGSTSIRVVVGEAADLAQMQSDLKAPAGVRIAALHVLAPPSYLPARSTRHAVDALLAAGADVVAVHGSHALGPVERRGAAIIAWGLGNLAFDCACTREDEAMILRVWRADGAMAGEVVPIRAGLGGRPAARHPDRAGIIALLQGLGSDIDAEGRVRSAVAVDVGAQPDPE
jgi:poly-gamma-glutamate capsule biosynthesis protein CapA/YwtB (metallophosphatase superfamily)